MENKGSKWFTILMWLGAICSVCVMFYFVSNFDKLNAHEPMRVYKYGQAKLIVVKTIAFMVIGLIIIAWNILKE